MKKTVKNTILLYDMCTLAGINHLRGDITAEGLAHYLHRQTNLKFPHRHSFYHLVYFTTTGGSHSIDFEEFEVQAGQIYFMAPGQVHSWHFALGTDGYIINFSHQLLPSVFRDGQRLEQFPFFSGVAATAVVQLHAARPLVERRLARIVLEAAGDAAMATEIICAELLSVLIEVMRTMPAAEHRQHAGHNQLLMSNFRKLVDEHYTQKKLPKEYAAMLYITPNHLNAMCREVLGRQAGEVIRDRILLEAKRLLAGHDISVAEIAWQLGFTDNSYFTRFFKKYTGVTPEHFRVAAR